MGRYLAQKTCIRILLQILVLWYAEGCYFDTAGYYLCIGSEHITQSDFQFVLHEFSFNTYQSEAYPSHILIEFLEDGYEQYSFDEWVLSYYEIIIRLAAMIREKTKGNQV